MQVFIPPKGALQFALNRSKIAKQPKDGPRAKIQDYIWVWPPVPNMMSCECEVSFPIIIDSLTEGNRDIARQVIASRPNEQLCTCYCQGEVIE